METSLSKYASVTSLLKAIAPTEALSVPKVKYNTLHKKQYLTERKRGVKINAMCSEMRAASTLRYNY